MALHLLAYNLTRVMNIIGVSGHSRGDPQGRNGGARAGCLHLREHVIALEPRGKGLLRITLRYPYEVRKEDEYFEDIPDEKIPKDILELASHIVETKSGHFEPEKCADHITRMRSRSF